MDTEIEHNICPLKCPQIHDYIWLVNNLVEWDRMFQRLDELTSVYINIGQKYPITDEFGIYADSTKLRLFQRF